MSDVPVQPSNEEEASLRRNTLGLRHAIIISVAVMSPAASIFFNTIPQAGLVGAAIPLCYLIGFIIALLVANQYSEFSREIPSSGSAYTFVTKGLGAIPGFLTAWVGLAAIIVGVPYSFVLLGANLETLVQRWFGLHLHWSFWFVLAIGIAFAICYLGVRQSMNVDFAFLAFEIGICLVLAGIVLFRVGEQGGLTLAPFTLETVPQGGDLTAGIILATLSYIGFETAAALGEETRNPHRNIPRAVFGSMIVVGLFYVLMAYVSTVGYGIHSMATGFANDPAPFDTLGRRYSGPLLAVLIDLVGLFSFFSAALAIINGGARIIYTVGRDGLLPKWTAWLHPVRQNPIGSVIMLCVLGLIVGLPLGFLLTPIQAFSFLGTLDALLILVIYALVSLASLFFFWRKRRARFKLFLHGILPAISILIILGILIAVIVSPSPSPLNLLPFVLIAWLMLGGIVIFMMRGKLADKGMQEG